MSEIAEARSRVQNDLGHAVERKATDDFCVSYLRSTQVHTEIAESSPALDRLLGGAVPMRPVVLEFERDIPRSRSQSDTRCGGGRPCRSTASASPTTRKPAAPRPGRSG